MGGRRIILLAAAIALAVLAVFNWLTAPSRPELSGLTVKVLAIGQGDAILIQSGRDAVLVDSGDVGARKELLRLLGQEGVKEFALVVATHPHADHIGGMEAVLDKYPVKKILDSGQIHTSKLFADYLKKVAAKKVEFVRAKPGERYQLDGGAQIEALWPEEEFLRGTDSDLNNNSVVLRLTKGAFSMLLTGDIQKEAEMGLLKKSGDKLKSDVLKAPHHGSNTSSTTAFLRAVNAEAVIISCGKNNDYGFPKPAVLRRYKENDMEIYITAKDGTVTVSADGKNYEISGELFQDKTKRKNK
ncbi:MAG: MBL fold metallo-hydrolase [Acidaminococcales bacterium]|jgi:competence protein ComEC|nr:MBL fold metallo-hydrolase [Acidaminococcales bacterium]